MSDWGETLGSFIKGLYWAVGILVALVVVLTIAVVYLLLAG
jgi:hypothetical protein